MCLVCGDADKGQKLQKTIENCDGQLKPYMTFGQLMDDLFRESSKTGKHIFNIFKGCLINPPEHNVHRQDNLTINFL
ncbi:MAG: hypothetical protein KDK44_05265 [Chlamydiia bacterium]|nr:hypothetical protein [Chlamydiia bacterium]